MEAKREITFLPYSKEYNDTLNDWHKQEKKMGQTGLDDFVVSRGSLLGDYITYIDQELDDIVCRLAFDQDNLVGFLCYSMQDEKHAHVEIMGIDPSQRNRGLARDMLIGFKKDMLQNTTAERITLSVKKENTSGIHSFSKVATESPKQTMSNYIDMQL